MTIEYSLFDLDTVPQQELQPFYVDVLVRSTTRLRVDLSGMIMDDRRSFLSEGLDEIMEVDGHAGWERPAVYLHEHTHNQLQGCWDSVTQEIVWTDAELEFDFTEADAERLDEALRGMS